MGYRTKDGKFTVDGDLKPKPTAIETTKLREMELDVRRNYCPYFLRHWASQLPDFLLCAEAVIPADGITLDSPPYLKQFGSARVTSRTNIRICQVKPAVLGSKTTHKKQLYPYHDLILSRNKIECCPGRSFEIYLISHKEESAYKKERTCNSGLFLLRVIREVLLRIYPTPINTYSMEFQGKLKNFL